MILSEAAAPFGDRLELDETWLSVDGPKLFTCVNETGARFLAFWVEADERGDGFVLLPMSKRRLAATRSGAISLRSALTDRESGRVGLLRIGAESIVEPLEDLDPSWLPADDVHVNLPVSALEAFDPEALPALSHSLRRPLAALKLTRQHDLAEYPIRPLGGLLQRVQDLVTLLAAEAEGQELPRRGPLRADIVDSTQLSVVGMGAGSLVIELAPEFGPSLFSESQAVAGFGTLLDVLEAATELEGFEIVLGQLSPRTVQKIAELFEDLADEGSGSTAYLVQDGAVREGSITLSGISSALERLREVEEEPPEEFTIWAALVGLNRRTRVFEVLAQDTEKKYSGKIEGRAVAQAAGAVIGAVYQCTIQGRPSISTVTGEETVKYSLVSLDRPSD